MIALVQFIALFCELKPEGSEWPTFGNKHEYWSKAAAFVQETTGTDYKRSGECSRSINFISAQGMEWWLLLTLFSLMSITEALAFN